MLSVSLIIYCIIVNILCCAACLCKIAKNGVGLHKDCNVCLIEDIKEEKNEKIKRICEKIDFNSYRDYLLNSGIDCWNKRNKKYHNIENYLYIKLYLKS